MWFANTLLFVVLCLTQLTSEVKSTSGTPLTPKVDLSRSKVRKSDETPPTMTYEFDSNGDVILPTVQTIDDRLPIFQYIDKSVLGYRIESGVTLVVIIGVDSIRKEHRIYLYSSPKHLEAKNNERIGDNTESKSMMLYICINCVFAEWFQNQLIEFVEKLPNMYKTLNVDANQNYCIRDHGELKKHIEYIEEKTKHFISILFKYITLHSYNTVNSLVDMSLLRMLVSTNILIHYISQHDEKSKVDNNIIVNKILKIVNDVQKFMAYNCDVVYSYYDNKYFFSYSMTKPKTHKYHTDIDEFLNELTEFGLETLLEQCSVRQMLLGYVLTSKDDVVMNELKKARLLVMDKPVVIDEKFFYAIEKSNDLDVIYWYTDIILDAIIRIFCNKTVSMLTQNRPLNIKITEGFKILSFLFTELTIDSEKVIEGFNFLASNQELTKAKKTELITVMVEYCKEFKFPKIDYATDSSKMFPFFKIVTLENASLPLETLMNSIINRVSDYKCFVNIFELLKIEHKQNYLSKMRNPSKVYEFVYSRIISKPADGNWQESLNKYLKNKSMINTESLKFRSASIDDNMCELFINMYEFCVEYCLALIWDEQLPVETRNKYNENVSNVIDGISKVLDHIFNNLKLNDRFIIELLLDIRPVLEIKRDQKTDWASEQNIVLIRILYIIMIELNKYGLEACTNDKYENLFFNIINYDTMGDHTNEYQAIIDKWMTFVPTIKSSIASILPNLYFSFEKIKTFFTDTMLCNDNIRMYWRGELKTFYQIHDNVKFDILNPYYVYALFDVYFKFQMALLYYDFIVIIEHMEVNKSIVSSREVSLVCHRDDIRNLSIDVTIFPGEFSENFKKCTKEFCVRKFTTDHLSPYKPPDTCKNVENTIKKIGIDFVLMFPYRDIKLLSREDNQQQIGPKEKKQMNNIIKNDIHLFSQHSSQTIKQIKVAQTEYEKFRKFYNHINFDGWS